MASHEKPPVAVVTAAGSGIGKACAEALAGTGVHVVVADINLEAAESVVAGIRDVGGAASSAYFDSENVDSIKAMYNSIFAEFGAPWILVNNAAWSGIQEPFLDNDIENWEKLARANYVGTMMMTQLFLRAMVDAGKGGRLINISSESARRGSPIETAYAATKGAINTLTRSLAREMLPHRITVNSVSPGPVDTPRLRAAPEWAQERWLKVMPMGRFVKPEEIAYAVKFLAAEDSSQITGQSISVNGGVVI